MDDKQSTPTERDSLIPEDFYLIVEGTQAIPLNKRVTSIGRSHENTVVIDDPRISRHHLEIRVIREQFVLFDLDSSGGTYVNGQRISQGMLYPGDLISLAGTNIVIARDKTLSQRAQTDPAKLGGHGEHVTAVFESAMRNKKKNMNS